MKKRPFASVAFLTVIGRSAGAVIPFCVAWAYGAGIETDAFFLAFGIIFFLFRIFSYIFESVIIPYFAEQKKTPHEMVQFANGVLFALIPIITLICIVIAVNLKFSIMHFNGWSAENSALVLRLFVELIPFLLFSVWISQASGLFYAYKTFWFPAVSPVLRSVVILAAIFFLRSRLGIHALSLGFLAGEGLRWIWTLVLLRGVMHWNSSVDWKQQGKRILDFFQQIFFHVLALSAVSAIYFIDLWFASRLAPGSVSILNYADRLLQIAYIFFQSGFLTIYHSFWSDRYYQESPAAFWQHAKKDIRLVVTVSCFISAVLFIFRSFFVHIVFGLGKFKPEELDILVKLFGWFAIGFTPVILYLLYSRVIFVMKKASFYCVLAYSLLALKIIFNIVFIQWWKLEGIAVSLVVSYGIIALWLWIYLMLHWRDKVPEKL